MKLTLPAILFTGAMMLAFTAAAFGPAMRWREFRYRRSSPNVDFAALSVWAFVELSGSVKAGSGNGGIPGISGDWTPEVGETDPDNPGFGSGLGTIFGKEDPDDTSPEGTPPYQSQTPYTCERNIAVLEQSRLTGFRPENATVYYGEVTEICGGNDIPIPKQTVYYYDVRPARHRYIQAGHAPSQTLTSDGLPRYVKTTSVGEAYSEQGYGAMYGWPLHNHGYFQENIGAQPLLLRKDHISYEAGRIRVAERYDYHYRKSCNTDTLLNVGNYIEALSFGRGSSVGSRFNFYDTNDFNAYHVSVKYDDIRCDSVIHTVQDESGITRTISFGATYADDTEASDKAASVFGIAVNDLLYRLPLLQSLTASCGDKKIERYYLYSGQSMFDRVHQNHPFHRSLPVGGLWINASDTILTTVQYDEFTLAGGKKTLLPVSERFGPKGKVTSELKIGQYSEWGHPGSVSRDKGNATLYKWGYDGDCIIDVQRQSTALHTRYSHIPLIGCTQISYPSGRAENYEYSAGRLTTLRNTAGQKVSSWKYQMAEYAGAGVNAVTSSVYLSESGTDMLETSSVLDAYGDEWYSLSLGYGGNGENIVSGYVERDGFGREIRRHNPYKTRYRTPYQSRFLPKQSTGIYSDSLTFSTTEYSSMLNRTVWRQSAGDDMAGKYTAGSFFLNRGDDPKLKCLTFTMRAPTSNVLLLKSTAPDGLYTVESVTDADGHERLTFTDFQGQKVLDRRIVDGRNLDTYYIYDGLGRLRYVLPPKLSNIQLARKSIERYGYIYCYDDSMLLRSKQLPGCEPVTYVYDGARNLVFSQDGEQRLRGEQTFRLYDHSGQPSVTGICPVMTSGISHSWALGDYQGSRCDNRGNTDSCGVRWTYGIPDPRLLKVNYYNDYDFLTMPPCRALAAVLPEGIPLTTRRGLPTGALTAILGPDGPTGEYEISLVTYDDEERPTAAVSLRPDGILETTFTEYTFDGLPSKLTHSVKNGTSVHTEVYATAYDHARRPLTTTLSVDGGTPRPLTTSTYDAIGRLATWRPGTEATVSYAYNVRNQLTTSWSDNFSETLHYTSGSLKACYNGNVSAYCWTVPEMPFQMYNYSYDGADRLISAALRNDGSGRDYSTTYTYDVNSNITALTRKGLLDDGSYGTVDDLTMTYTGNQLTRVNDAAAEVLLENSLDFNDGADQTDEITYDSRGYMTSDLNRGITEIRYNHAGLPAEVYIDEVKRYTFTYNADGQMLSRTEHITPSSLPETTPGVILPPGTGLLPGLLPWPGSGGRDTTTTSTTPVTMPAIYRYAGSQLWFRNSLERIETEAGMIIGDTLHAAYRDFQGNVRVVVANGRVRQVTHYYPYGLPWAEIKSPSHSLRKYSSKEFYTRSGYDTYNFEARQYYPAVPRFTTPDPLAEKLYDTGVYTYCSGNPINYIDKSGLYPKKIITENNVKRRPGTIYKIKPAAGYLLSLITGIPENKIKDIEIWQRGLGHYLPWYSCSQGGGGITIGAKNSHVIITLTENYFEDDITSYDGNGYGQDIDEWLDILSHEVVHYRHTQEFNSKILYSVDFMIDYLKSGNHDSVEREIEADHGRYEFRSFNQYIKENKNSQGIKSLFDLNISENTRKKILTVWWNEYKTSQ